MTLNVDSGLCLLLSISTLAHVGKKCEISLLGGCSEGMSGVCHPIPLPRNKRIIYINWKNPSCSEAFPTLSTHQQSTHSLWVSVWDWGRGPGNHFLFSYSCLQKPRQPVRHTHLWGSSTYGDEEEGLRGRVIQSTATRTP